MRQDPKIKSLKCLLTGGDKLSSLDLNAINYKLINNYGPTEYTVVATNYTLSGKEKEAAPPIGKPISNTRIYIVSREGELAPVGVGGEICISGEGIARGYLNRPDLTAEKFVPNPFSSETGARMYKTGDLGRWLHDGNLEYLGRIDDQVKIRGYRIEPGEIESVLLESGLVSQAVVVALPVLAVPSLRREDKQGTKRLVAYVVSEGAFDKQTVISYLHGKLPDFMVPALWVQLTHLPLTPNGKIDKKALPDPDAGWLSANEYAAPRNEPESKLVQVWQELLGTERIGIDDNFFELGGDSIITIQVVSRARRMGYELQPKDIFIHQTVRQLSLAIAQRDVSWYQESRGR
jgi:acyl-CoA synthetase (AMP-forming)/AMP-acid ligase II/aryl carrier-like protein